MNVDTGRIYETLVEQQQALMRGEHIVPVEQAREQAQRLNATGPNRHERRRAAALARKQRIAPGPRSVSGSGDEAR